MTQEDKKLLLKDLSARLPYGVFCSMGLDYPLPLQRLFINKLDGTLLDFYEDGKDYQVYLSEVKPYLRPMSSMTEEEKEELNCLCYHNIDVQDNMLQGYLCGSEINDVIDWLISHRFDYRTDDEGKTMIEKSLAIEVTENNNPYK